MTKIFLSLFFLLSTSLAFGATEIAFFRHNKIAYTIEKKEFYWPKSGDINDKLIPYDAYALNVVFGKISRPQFDLLKKRYGNHSEVTYSPTRQYRLVDFLSPAMQALNEKQFVPQFLKAPWPEEETIQNPEGYAEIDELIQWAREIPEISLATNCWGTSIAVLRDLLGKSKALEFGWVGRTQASDRVSGKENFSQVRAGELRFGDVILVETYNEKIGEHVAQHAAVAIEPELVFERTDSSENDAFRISFRADVENKMKLIFEDGARISYHRMKPAAEVPSLAETDLMNKYGDLYDPYISREWQERIVIGIDFTMSGKPIGHPSAYDVIQFRKNADTGIYELEPSAKAYRYFRAPRFK